MTALIKFKIHAPSIPLPEYETAGSAGADLRAYLPDGTATLYPGEMVMIPTGLYVEIAEGFEIQVRPRSGLAAKHNITVSNSPGTIDSDYRGEIKVMLSHHGHNPFRIENGDRIAQMVVAQCIQGTFEVAEELSETDRGQGGFGSTGVK